MKTSHVLAGAAASAAALLFFALPLVANATTPNTWYVNASAAANGDGTTAVTATTTIQAAINAASAGDTIDVAAGTYTENSAGPNEVNVNKSVTIIGAAGAELVVANGATVNGFNVTANNVTIEGFDIDGPANQSYLTYAWGGNVTRGIVINNGVTNFTITDNTVQNLRNDILIDGRNTGSVTNNTIDNSKSGISVQYTDAGAGNTEGYTITISGNKEGTYGNDWGLNVHLNGDINTTPAFTNSQKIATNAPASVQTALITNSAANGGWSVQDQGYSDYNRTSVVVSPTGASANQGDPLGALDTFQNGVNAVVSGGTVNVSAGTYSGDVSVALDNITIKGTGNVVLNLASGYGFNLDTPPTAVTGFTMSGITVNASPSTTYAFKAYKADGLTLTNDTFNGGAGNTGGGVDINDTSNVTFNNVTSSGFHKNGFADTSAYTSADSATSGNNITFNNITSSNNGWTGISFYTAGNAGGSASINGVKFTGTNIISGNGSGGATQGGIFIEGDTDANLGAGNTPANTVTSDGTTLDLSNVALSGSNPFDVINYQTAGVNALATTFGGSTGTAMNSSQRTTEDGKIYDQLDKPVLGLVHYWNDTTAPSVPTDLSFSDPSTIACGGITNVPTITSNWAASTDNVGVTGYTYYVTTPGVNNTSNPFITPVATNSTGGDFNQGDGVYTFKVDAFDAAGNHSAYSTSCSITFDSTAPVVTVTPQSGSVLHGTENFDITVTDANLDTTSGPTWVYLYNTTTNQEIGASVDLSQGSGVFTVDTTQLPDGSYDLDVGQVHDAAGNASGAGDNYFTGYTIDNTAPSVPTNLGFSDPLTSCGGTTNSPTITATWDPSTDANGVTGYNYYVTTPGVNNSSNPFIVTDPTNSQSGDFNQGNGIYTFQVSAFDASGNTSAYSTPCSIDYEAPATVTTNAATGVTDTNSTLNGTDGSTNADNTSFWWGTTNAGPFTAATDPSSELPSGWSHDSGLGSVSANGQFNEAFTTLTPGTTYYFAAWVESNGTWYPGSVESFTTTGTAPTASVTTDNASSIDATDATLNGQNGGIAADNTSFWWGTTAATSFTAAADPSSELPSGWSHDSGLGTATANGSFNEPLTGLSAGTEYYFTAWSQVGGIWYPGTVMNFTTVPTTPPAPTPTSPIDGSTLTTSQWTEADWTSVTDASTPITYIYESSNSPATNTDGSFTTPVYQSSALSSPTIATTGTQPGDYYWHVKAVDSANNSSPWSTTVHVTVNADPVVATPGVTTNTAQNVSSTDATLEATNGGVDADAESFWVSTSTIDFSNPNNIPNGVYSTQVLGGVSAGSSFQDQLSEVTTAGITTGGVQENMMPITPSTTYYYVAWSNVNNQWYNGGQQTLTTAVTPPTAPTTQSDTATTDINTPVTIDVLANDTGATSIDSATLTQPADGSATIDANKVVYTPNSNFAGSDSFTYQAKNSVGDSAVTTVSVTVKDTATPVLTVVGNNPAYIEADNASYSDAGVTVSDAGSPNIGYVLSFDGEATTSITAFNSSDVLSTTTPGTHTVLYAATNGGGNTGYATRTIVVLASPTVALTSSSATTGTISDNPIHMTATFSEPVQNFTSASVTVTNGVVSNIQLNGTTGSYTSATFDVTPDANGTVTVEVKPDAVENMAGATNADDEQMSFNYAATVTPTQTQTVTPSFVSFGGGGSNGPISGSLGSAPVALANNGQNSGGGPIGAGGEVLGASTYNFANNFCTGANGEDVTQLQTILIADGYLAIDAPTGYYGALTKAAVVEYQKANGITPTTGCVGPKTRAVLNAGVTPTQTQENSSVAQALEAQLKQLLKEIAAMSTTTSTTTTQ